MTQSTFLQSVFFKDFTYVLGPTILRNTSLVATSANTFNDKFHNSNMVKPLPNAERKRKSTDKT